MILSSLPHDAGTEWWKFLFSKSELSIQISQKIGETSKKLIKSWS